MSATNPAIQGTLHGPFVAKRIIHRGACGTWHEAIPSASLNGAALPTEFTSAIGGVSQVHTLVAREPVPGEVLGTDAVGIAHRHLAEVTEAAWMTDTAGRRLFVQCTPCVPRGAASQLAPDQVVVQWRQLVSAVASALAHLHALGLTHGAVQLNNIFQKGDTWQLGPSLCNRAIGTTDDLQALASLIGTELYHLVSDPREMPLLVQLSNLCRLKGVEAAHISVWAEEGVPDAFPPPQPQVPPMPKVERTSDGFRLSCRSDLAIVLLCCEPHRVPKAGSMVPVSQLDQLGAILPVSSPGEAGMPRPRHTTVVFSVDVSSGVATVGHHSLVDPPRGWGDLHALMRQEGVVLRWFWPQDISCRTVYVQIRRDRYPRQGGDDDVRECHRTAYEAAGQYLVPVPEHWNHAFVRVARADAAADKGQDAVYAKVERKPPVTMLGTLTRLKTPPVRIRAARS